MRLIADVLLRAENFINAAKDRELNLRGLKIPAIENLAVVQDQFDAIDFSDNDIKKVDNFPTMKRLTSLHMSNNQITKIAASAAEYIPNLLNLVLTNNKISNIIEIEHLSSFQKLEHLSLMDNPIAYTPSYRLLVIFKLPALKSLDFQRIKPAERLQAKKFFQTAPGLAILSEISNSKDAEISQAVSSSSSRQTHAPPPPPPAPVKPATVILTDAQKAEIREAISKAVSKEDVDRIEKQMRTGTFPFKSAPVDGSAEVGKKRLREDGSNDEESSHQTKVLVN